MSTTLPQISILGCGWLGLPLAEALLKQGHHVKGSTTRESRMSELAGSGVIPFCLSAGEDQLKGPAAEFLAKSEILIINIPPGLRKDPKRDFARVVFSILEAVRRSQIQHILYISSTSVFPDMDRVFSETDQANPDTKAGKQLKAAEHLIMEEQNTTNTILRFGGLLNGDRHPVRFLSGKKGLHGGSHSINLIHRDDCIGLILSVIRKNFWGHTLHGVAPCHIPKRDYYTAIAGKLQLPPPEFDNNGSASSGKVISGEQTSKWLDYTFLNSLC